MVTLHFAAITALAMLIVTLVVANVIQWMDLRDMRELLRTEVRISNAWKSLYFSGDAQVHKTAGADPRTRSN